MEHVHKWNPSKTETRSEMGTKARQAAGSLYDFKPEWSIGENQVRKPGTRGTNRAANSGSFSIPHQSILIAHGNQADLLPK